MGHGSGSVVARGRNRCDSTVQLVGLLRDFEEFGPFIEGSLIGGFRVRETGGRVRGRAGEVVVGSDERRVRRPASHHQLDFVEGAIDIIIRSRGRGERIAIGVVGEEVRGRLVSAVNVVVVVMAIDSGGSWSGSRNPGRDFA